LWACWSRYGLVSPAKRFGCRVFVTYPVSPFL
jgi:hypothetical protein